MRRSSGGVQSDTAVQSIIVLGRDSVIDSGHAKVIVGARWGRSTASRTRRG